MSSKIFFQQSFKIKTFSDTFHKKHEFVSLWHHSDYNGKRWTVWKSVSFGSFSAPNLCFIQSFQTFPVKHSSAFSFHDNLPFIHQPASNNFLLSPKKSLKTNFIQIPWLMCCFSAESKNIHYYGDFHLRPATQKRASLQQ